MSLTKADKQAIRLISETFNLINSMMEKCKPNEGCAFAPDKNSTFVLMGMDYVNNFKLLKDLAEELKIYKAYHTKEIAMLFPDLTTVEINKNNLFIATEKLGNKHQVVIFWTGEQI